jgi:hypothetical protein
MNRMLRLCQYPEDLWYVHIRTGHVDSVTWKEVNTLVTTQIISIEKKKIPFTRK